ncbi:MAG: hypothetical protein IPL35_10625 [Sphingobacteriales bacterium]|nr:hypothetical protein [Sphingobacteriales bacterium]
MNEEDKRNLEVEWQRLLYRLKGHFKRKPTMEAVLFLIGVQELGQLQRAFTKEEKQDLMHIAVCKLMSKEGYYDFSHYDEEGWPHYSSNSQKTAPAGLKEQETLLKQLVLEYINNI